MIRIGLTGSIGMGKSTTAGMFADLGVPVHDADETVHALYEGEAVTPIEEAFPGVARDGKIDRVKLSQMVVGKPEELKRLEKIVHPLVHAAERRFLKDAARGGHDLVLLDIPLLFETGGENRVDVIVVVTASAEEQERRVMSRPGMTKDKFNGILSRQLPDEEKRKRADFIVDTQSGLESARQQVADIVTELRNKAVQESGKE